jgi:hypothetical protein
MAQIGKELLFGARQSLGMELGLEQIGSTQLHGLFQPIANGL